MKNFAEKHLIEVGAKLKAIRTLGCKNARATHRLLVSSGNHLMSYLASTVPPCVMMDVLRRFDWQVEAAFFGAIAPEGFSTSASRRERARSRMRLAAPLGCSLFSSTDRGKIAWLSSVAACLSDPLLFQLREGLRDFVQPALDDIVSFIGIESHYWSQVEHVLPSTADLFLGGNTFSPEDDYKVKIGTPILKTISHIRLQEYLGMTKVDQIGDEFTKEDALRANSHTEAGRIFVTKFTKLCFVFTDEEYTAWCRSFLGIPPQDDDWKSLGSGWL